MIEHGLFWGCCLLAALSAVGAATVRNLFHAALLLGLCLLGVAGLYLFLQAWYLACIQVVVYLGGILVLVLFATLFSSDILGQRQVPSRAQQVGGVLAAGLGTAAGLHLLVVTLDHGLRLEQQRGPVHLADTGVGTAGGIGDLLVGSWFAPFLVAGVLLTVALVGAVATVKRYRRPAGGSP
ncbi:MAG: hypothetical protein RL148_2461 [Planctomycetota bacterium]